MNRRQGVLLTGATGLLGRYLLRDLLLSGHPVAVLTRPGRGGAVERVAELVAFWSEQLGESLRRPVVLEGDLRTCQAGLTSVDRSWLARNCEAVVHAAAQVAFREAPEVELWRTNVEGTRHLVELGQSVGVSVLHHVSTVFVCGEHAGPVREEAWDRGQRFRNHYERSKFEAEGLVRRARGLQTTVYRPSVLVGDSRTGYTSSYHGFYRFLELAARLAALQEEPHGAGSGAGRRYLPLRLPFTGDEPQNLVPVDWVAQTIVRLVNAPEHQGRTYHLVADQPVPARFIKEVAEVLLGIEGVQWAGPGRLPSPTALESLFLDYLQDYWPYFAGTPELDNRNTRAVLPELPPPRVVRPLLTRLVRFAVADRWGRARRGQTTARGSSSPCARYIEQFLPANVEHSVLVRAVALDLTLAFEIRGPGGGRWSCRWVQGRLADIRHGLEPSAVVTYRTDVATFDAIVRGDLAPSDAFFAQRIAIEGDVETALKLAVLFGEFIREFPYRSHEATEATDATPLRDGRMDRRDGSLPGRPVLARG
jgi:nucleoside-diphosphate-sugar epimerase